MAIPVDKPEILAPAGSIEALDAALSCGADAVYIGGERFGARAYADNPGEAALCAAIDRAHIFGKKIYLTVNTLFKEQELEAQLVPFLAPYVACGLDGVIVQDFGALDLMHAAFPDLPLHASTQMAVTGARGAALLAQRGITRVVPARELSLDELIEIREQSGLEVECFVHGAMCYSCSGMCLMSSMIGGRSGNRGRCAGFCRTPFSRADAGRASETDLLSMKDLCAIEHLPALVRAGVASLKIEGRMKRPAYAAKLSEIYRKYLDLACSDPEHYAVEESDLRTLRVLFNRDGFTDGYFYRQNGREMIAVTDRRDPEEGTSRTRAAQALYEEVDAMLASRRMQRTCDGILTLQAGVPMELRLTTEECSVCVRGAVPERAERAPVDDDRIREQLNKTGQSLLCFSKLEIRRNEDTPLFISLRTLGELRRAGIAALEERILAPHRMGRIRDMSGDRQAGQDAAKDLPGDRSSAQTRQRDAATKWQIRVSDHAQLTSVLAAPGMRGSEVYLPVELADQHTVKRIRDAGLQCAVALPHLVRAGMREKIIGALNAWVIPDEIGHILVSDLEGLGILADLGLTQYAVADGALYTMNQRAEEFLAQMGVGSVTAPLELNATELLDRDNAHSAMTIYGRAPLMISAQCIAKTTTGCTRRSERIDIRDRKGVVFPVQCVCDASCYNIIYNSVPTELFTEMEVLRNCGFAAYRLSFTTETAQETSEILHIAETVRSGAARGQTEKKKTKGHFRRGVL